MKKVLDRLWEKLNGINYIVLRNYANLNSEVSNGGDIDILCESKEKIIECLDLVSRSSDKNEYNFKTIIEGIHIPIDVRSVGDGYYDAEWEKGMLRRKTLYKGYYVIGNYDDDFSLLYHILIHKFDVPEKYKKFINERFDTEDTGELIKKLRDFMNENGYIPVKPMDRGVCFNIGNYEVLKNL